jgi:hypothetical protein
MGSLAGCESNGSAQLSRIYFHDFSPVIKIDFNRHYFFTGKMKHRWIPVD